MKTTKYIAPAIEVVELEADDRILTQSVTLTSDPDNDVDNVDW